ncbi:MAG TPA: XRE family transcriptional regulator [Caulobacterales bacterium]|nr:XRE family transcriptional regulator [Caulobacterales bacterium]
MRKLRLAKGFTLAELSERTGVPLSTLSKLELGQSALGYEKLLLICRALGVDPGLTMLQDPLSPTAPSGRRAVSRAAEGAPHRLGPHECRMIAGDLLSKCFTPLIMHINVRSLSEHGPMHTLSGETYLYVLEGAALVHTDIYAPLALDTGESVYFDGRIGHAILANGHAPCRALLIVAGDETPSPPEA